MSISSFRPIRIGRSDGQLEIRSKKYGRESNSPSADQLDRVANPEDYYELLDPDHPIAIEWKRMLGGMLQKECGDRSNQRWFLVVFPENYRLYRHIRPGKDPSVKKADHTGSQVKTSSKADEAYLYGYPLGRLKRFKSPYEFFAHLFWLAEDKSEDYSDCTCRYCALDWVQRVEPLPGREGFAPAPIQASSVKKEVTSAKKDNVAPKKETLVVKKDTAASVPKVVIKQRPGPDKQTTISTKAAPPPVQASTSTQPSAARTQQASLAFPSISQAALVTNPRSVEQAEDAQYQKYIYRPGEVVWFNRGQAWGLAMVVKRDISADQQGRPRPRYLVQPLSHPFSHPDPKLLTSEDHIRPWLAWSAPSPTHQKLNKTAYSYNSIDWPSVAAGKYGEGDAEVDGSIFAARMIDDSFTLVEPLSNNTITTGERTYNAIFLGGEKIWVGEPIRLRTQQGNDIMVIRQIVEKLKSGSTNVALASIFVCGDVYRYMTVPASYPTTPEAMPSMDHLPVRMREDLKFRNSVTGSKKHTISFWKPVSPQARVNIAEVKGRWYESSILLPILQGPEAFQTNVARGEVADVGTWINARQDSNQAGGKLGTRIKDRSEAFGRSIPHGLRIGQDASSGQRSEGPSLGLVAQPEPQMSGQATNADPGVGMSIGGEGRAVTGVGDGDIAEFMDLDKMEDGFAKEYVEANNNMLNS